MNTAEKVIIGVVGAVLASIWLKRIRDDITLGPDDTAPAEPFELPMPEVKWLQATKFGQGRQGRKVELVVIHTSENAEVQGGAHAVASFFALPDAKTSAHYTVDNAEIWQSVDEADTAWHAAPSNFNSIGIEHVTRANSSVEQWHDAYSQSELDLSARLVASLCLKYGIPIRHLTVSELKAGESGIVGHKDVNAAFGQGDHSDPGAHFPWDEYIAKVLQYAQGYVA